MNLERIIRITSCFFFLSGYHIRWYDRKSLSYRLPLWGILYFLLIFVWYLICLCHHFEISAVLKVLLDMSPFLKDLVRLHVLLGLKVFVFCIIAWKDLTKISNGLVLIIAEGIKRPGSFDRWEAIVYLMFFSTLVVAFVFVLYIAIEMEFKLPTLDQLMIFMALFMPHFTLAGCLRFYTLGLWLIRGELVSIQKILKEQQMENTNGDVKFPVVIEVTNPVLNEKSNGIILFNIYEKMLNRLTFISDYIKLFDGSLQRQLNVLVGLNFNCLLAGVYARLYFENYWNVLFSYSLRRIFYAANSAIFVCILMDYGILLVTRGFYYTEKHKLYNMTVTKLLRNKSLTKELRLILKHMKSKLSKEFKLKLFGLVEFNVWNFLMFQGLMISIIVIIVNYQHLTDQIKILNERLDLNDSE